MLWPQAPKHPSYRLLQKIKSCAYHQKKISSSSPCPFKITHRLSMYSGQAWAVWQASTKTWSRFLNSRNTEIPLCLALPTRGYCLSLQFKARHLSVKSQPVFSRKPKNLQKQFCLLHVHLLITHSILLRIFCTWDTENPFFRNYVYRTKAFTDKSNLQIAAKRSLQSECDK